VLVDVSQAITRQPSVDEEGASGRNTLATTSVYIAMKTATQTPILSAENVLFSECYNPGDV
jgi:hypothetical protein